MRWFRGVFEGIITLDSIDGIAGFMQSLWGELLLSCSDLSEFLPERRLFVESVNVNGILFRSLNLNGKWAKFFRAGNLAGNLAENSLDGN